MENQSFLKSCAAAVKRFEGSKAFMFSKECFDLLSNDPPHDSPPLYIFRMSFKVTQNDFTTNAKNVS